MTEASYTAWDGNLYEWPPPEGWYQAADGRWWPEGYGPTEATAHTGLRDDEPAAAGADGPAVDPGMTAVFPAGGPVEDLPSADERLEAESQRPVFDELPPIDDVFGGKDPYADDNEFESQPEPEPAGDDGASTFDDVPLDEPDLDEGDGADRDGAEPAPAEADLDPVDDGDEDDEREVELVDTDVVDADSFAIDGDDDDHAESDAYDDELVDEEPVHDELVEDDYVTAVAEEPDPAATQLATGFHLGELPAEGEETALVEVGDLFSDPGPSSDRALERSPSGPRTAADGPVTATIGDRSASVGSPFSDADHYGESPPIDGSATIDDHRAPDPAAADYDDSPDSASPVAANWPIMAAVLALLVAVGGIIAFLVLQGDDDEPTGFDIEASQASTDAGSLGVPYTVGTGVVVFYNDQTSSEEHRWVLQIVEPVSDRTGELVAAGQVVAPPEGEVLAVTRVRLTYQSGPAPGQVTDLEFSTIGQTLEFFTRADRACVGGPDLLDLAAQLAPGEAIEGNLCWRVPGSDLDDLKLAIEAGPVEGIVFMELN